MTYIVVCFDARREIDSLKSPEMGVGWSLTRGDVLVLLHVANLCTAAVLVTMSECGPYYLRSRKET